MQNKPKPKQTNKTDLYLLVDQQRPAFSASAAKLHPNPNCETLLKLDQQQQQQQQPAPVANSSDTSSEAGDGGGVASETASAAPAVTPPPLSVAVEVTVPSTPGGSNSTGCNCFGSKVKGKGKKRWTSSTDTPEMSEVYCPSCEDAANETPACLSKMPDKRQTRLKPKPPSILCVESELVVSGKRGSLRLGEQKRSSNSSSKGGNNITRSVSLSAADRRTSVPIPVLPKKVAAAPVRVRLTKKEQDKAKEKEKDKEKDKENDKKSSNQKGNLLSRMSPKRLRNAKASDKEKEKEKDKPKEKSKVPVKTKIAQSSSLNGNSNNNNDAKTTRIAPKALSEEYEIADDATSLNGEAGVELGELGAGGGAAKMAILSESDSKLMISVRGREELPVVEQTTTTTTSASSPSPSAQAMQCFVKCLRVPVKSESHPLQLDQPDQVDNATNDNNQDDEEEESGELGATAAVTPLLNGAADVANGNQPASTSATLPRTSKQSYYNKVLHLVPKRRTPDGTNIYYWCDLPKKALKGYKSLLIHNF